MLPCQNTVVYSSSSVGWTFEPYGRHIFKTWILSCHPLQQYVYIYSSSQPWDQMIHNKIIMIYTELCFFSASLTFSKVLCTTELNYYRIQGQGIFCGKASAYYEKWWWTSGLYVPALQNILTLCCQSKLPMQCLYFLL